jgi:RNA polymerase sigma-70 factor (ECF subfamily)
MSDFLELSALPCANTGEREMTWSETIRDREAFTALYRAHQPAVFRFALSMSGEPGVAAEVTQDVFVWLIHHPDRFDSARGELSSFLLGVARKFLLRRGRDEKRLVLFDEKAHAVAEPEAHGPEYDIEALRAAIAALPPRYRELVVMCDLEGLTYEEAAAATGCATGTVRSRLHRARQFLGRKLESGKRIQGCAV